MGYHVYLVNQFCNEFPCNFPRLSIVYLVNQFFHNEKPIIFCPKISPSHPCRAQLHLGPLFWGDDYLMIFLIHNIVKYGSVIICQICQYGYLWINNYLLLFNIFDKQSNTLPNMPNNKKRVSHKHGRPLPPKRCKKTLFQQWRQI